MRLTFWIYFDNPGEKEKLKKIMDEPYDDFEKNRLIQEEFGVDLLQQVELLTHIINQLRNESRSIYC